LRPPREFITLRRDAGRNSGGKRMDPDLIGYVSAAGVAAAVVAFFVGRGTGAGAARRRELEEQLAAAHGEIARQVEELEALRDQLRAAREEHEAYRLSVVDHFSGTSDLLRDLTVQYRSVYEHLTKGASLLCPEGFVGLTEGLPVPEIAEPSRGSEAAGSEERSQEPVGAREAGPPDSSERSAADGDAARNAATPTG
jgi:uncharacterized membrane-anchored protein YhcB (DUF1043 family)